MNICIYIFISNQYIGPNIKKRNRRHNINKTNSIYWAQGSPGLGAQTSSIKAPASSFMSTFRVDFRALMFLSFMDFGSVCGTFSLVFAVFVASHF